MAFKKFKASSNEKVLLYSLLSSFLDFLWEETSKTDPNRVDMKVLLDDDAFIALLSTMDGSVGTYKTMQILLTKFKKADKALKKLQNIFKSHIPPGLALKCNVVLRMTRGPTNGCVNFHCDPKYSIQIALNSPSNYVGGELCYFLSNSCAYFVSPRAGSLVRHPPNILYGITNLTQGSRKSLFLVDGNDNSGSEGVIEVNEELVKRFLSLKWRKGREIQIFAKTHFACQALLVKPRSTIASVKSRIKMETSIPGHRQRLLFQGVELQDYRTLSSYNITHNEKLRLVVRELPQIPDPFVS